MVRFFELCGKIMKNLSSFLTLCALCISLIPSAWATDITPDHTGTPTEFTITAYYSPLPNQSFYVTGSYAAEIRLNGKGTHAADGTPVYPGMIAGPPGMAYGTQICVPGFGCGMVHDRGQAIVHQGVRDKAVYDRLDLWMGYGEEGLLRAMNWGMRHVSSEVFPVGYENIVAVDFSVPPALYELITLPQKTQFNTNLAVGTIDPDVEILEQKLFDLGLFMEQPDTMYDISTRSAVLQFQKEYFILDADTDAGAGIFGPSTRSLLTQVIYTKEIEKELRNLWDDFHFEDHMKKGARNEDVFRLQALLVQGEYMDVQPTGFFGPATQAALIEFQKDAGLIPNENVQGAGTVGPNTVIALNSMIEDSREWRDAEQAKQYAYESAWQSKKKLVFIAPLKY